MVLPERPLIAGATRRFGRLHGEPVHGQRAVLERECHLPVELLQQLFQIRMNLLAIRAFVIRELDQCYGSAARAPHHSTVEGNLRRWRRQRNEDAVLVTQVFEILGAGFAYPELVNVAQNLIPHRGERLFSAHTLVIHFQLIRRGIRNMADDVALDQLFHGEMFGLRLFSVGSVIWLTMSRWTNCSTERCSACAFSSSNCSSMN